MENVLIIKAYTNIFRKQNSKIKLLEKRLKRLQKKNNNLIHSNVYSAVVNILTTISTRSSWMKPRSSENWNLIVNQTYTDVDWVENFRMKKNTFNILCGYLEKELAPKFTTLKPRDPLSVEKQVAVALYKMCSCCEYRVVGSVFGIHKSTVKKCVYRVVNAINKIMLRDYINMPSEIEAEEISLHFEEITKIPMILASIDGTHIPITPPTEGYRDYINRKGWPSFNVQAVVDHRCRFRNISIKYPGSAHDAKVFKGSGLYKHHDKVLPKKTKNVNGKNISYFIIGDPAYPLLDWLVKGFSGAMSPEEESFNCYLNSGRVVVEWAFGRLKARFRFLCKKVDINYQFVPNIVIACCILHNFIEDHKESFMHQWMNDVDQADILIPQPSHTSMGKDDLNSTEIRELLCNYLLQNFPLKKSLLR